MTKRRGRAKKSPAQIAAAKKNLEKARAARAKNALRKKIYPDGVPDSRRAVPKNVMAQLDSKGRAAITHRHKEAQIPGIRAIRQYGSSHGEFEDKTEHGKKMKRAYTRWLQSAEAKALQGNRVGKNRRRD